MDCKILLGKNTPFCQATFYTCTYIVNVMLNSIKTGSNCADTLPLPYSIRLMTRSFNWLLFGLSFVWFGLNCFVCGLLIMLAK